MIRLPLKLLLPLMMFLIGLSLTALQTFVQMKIAYNDMAQEEQREARATGSRLANGIMVEVAERGFNRQGLVTLTAPYIADNLDQTVLYDQRLKKRFVNSVVGSKAMQESFDRSLAFKVLNEQFALVEYLDDKQKIVGYFPIDLPVSKGDVRSKDVGVLYLDFDISKALEKTRYRVVNIAAMNLSIVIVMVAVLSVLLYYLFIRRLDKLHKATQQMTQGEFESEVVCKNSDELAEVIDTFNAMSRQMHAFRVSMQQQVDQAVMQRTQQSKMLIHQSRLASMGEMIGNIAHQWRQPLNALSLIIQKLQIFSQRQKLSPEQVDASVEKATQLIQTMSRTIDDFRDFFRPDKSKDRFTLKEVVQNVIDMVFIGFKHEHIEIIVEIDPRCEIEGYKNEFSQVILNLVNNSRDALIEKGVTSKKIWIRGWEEENKTILKVSDNGRGIPVQIIDRIFEPYFTTKEAGKGSGIGLYMSKMIIEENMQGTITAVNGTQGAEFSICFIKEERR